MKNKAFEDNSLKDLAKITGQLQHVEDENGSLKFKIKGMEQEITRLKDNLASKEKENSFTSLELKQKGNELSSALSKIEDFAVRLRKESDKVTHLNGELKA